MSDASAEKSDTSEEKLFGLIEIAERQQNVAQTALEGMAKERIALGQEVQQLSDGVTQLQNDIHSTVSKAIVEE